MDPPITSEAAAHSFEGGRRSSMALKPIPSPGSAGEEVGGDFYDVFRTEDERVGIIIGDVSGKGVEAASLAAAT